MQKDTFEVRPFPDLTGFVRPAAPGPRMRICIATEEVFGPVRNGGIASTYFHLARILAEEGHDVTVCYLKGRASDTNTIEHWIAFYADLGLKLVPLPKLKAEGASFWQPRHYSFYLWLKGQVEPFDIVHVSEWRGGAYYSLLAKGQGIAFHDTVFLVKASSPHIWNRHYLMSFVQSEGMLAMMYGEQISIERGDLVIGGSAHLLRFMEHVGYTLPEGRTHVQPNVLTQQEVEFRDGRPPVEIGERMAISEVAFFGRLEARKGLEIFCEALDFLVDRGTPPPRVSFLGKEAGRLPTAPDLTNNEYIRRRAEKWPFPVEIHNEFNQTQVLTYLTEAPRLAVMPSLIENSSMAVYEALYHRIPFLATAVGGTPELVDPAHQADTLVEADPASLADGIARCLADGALVARCAFDNDRNLAVWHDFHEHLAGMKGDGRLTALSAPVAGPGTVPRISLCVVTEGDAETLAAFLDAAIHEGGADLAEIVVATLRPSPELEATVAETSDVPCRLVNARECSLGTAWNRAAAAATGDLLFFLRADIHRPVQGFAGILARAYAHSAAAGFSSVWTRVARSGGERLVLPIGGDMAMATLDCRTLSGNGVAVRAEAFSDVGGFSDIHGIGGLAQDLLVRTAQVGSIEVIPECLYTERPAAARIRLNEVNAQYLALSSRIAAADYPMKRVYLALGHLKEASEESAIPAGRRVLAQLGEDSRWINGTPLRPPGYAHGAVPLMRLALDRGRGRVQVRVEKAPPGTEVELSVALAGRQTPIREERIALDPDGCSDALALAELLDGKLYGPTWLEFTCEALSEPARRRLEIDRSKRGNIVLTSSNAIEELGGETEFAPPYGNAPAASGGLARRAARRLAAMSRRAVRGRGRA